MKLHVILISAFILSTFCSQAQNARQNDREMIQKIEREILTDNTDVRGVEFIMKHYEMKDQLEKYKKAVMAMYDADLTEFEKMQQFNEDAKTDTEFAVIKETLLEAMSKKEKYLSENYSEYANYIVKANQLKSRNRNSGMTKMGVRVKAQPIKSN